jgi:replicative DNA helicase
MNSNISLLKLFFDKNNFNRWYYLVNKDILTDELRLLMNDLYIYYKDNDTFQVSEFLMWFSHVRHTTFNKVEADLFAEMITSANNYELQNPEHIIKEFYAKELSHKIQELIQSNKFTKEKLDKIMEEYNGKLMTTEYGDWIDDTPLEELFSKENTEPVYSWKLSYLNQSTGGIFKGDLIIVAAPTGTGKSAFLVDTALHVAKQTDKTIWYLVNEEKTMQVKQKLMRSCLLQYKKSLSKANFTQSFLHDYDACPTDTKVKLYIEVLGDRKKIRVVDITNKSVYSIIDFVKRLKDPGLVIVDLASEVGVEQDAIHTMMNARAKKLKDLAKEIDCPILGAFQGAPGTAWTDLKTGETVVKKCIHFTDAQGSKGVAGPADVFIGIGKDKDFKESRNMWVSKTRHGGECDPREVLFNGEECSYLDL